MDDILGSFKIETKSEKAKKALKSHPSLFIPIESSILLILSNEYVIVNIILLCGIYHESFLQLQSLKCQESEYLI